MTQVTADFFKSSLIKSDHALSRTLIKCCECLTFNFKKCLIMLQSLGEYCIARSDIFKNKWKMFNHFTDTFRINVLVTCQTRQLIFSHYFNRKLLKSRILKNVGIGPITKFLSGSSNVVVLLYSIKSEVSFKLNSN